MYYALQLLIEISLFPLTTQQKIEPRIFSGNRTTIDRSGGFAVQIYVENHLLCTGSLISDRYIVTSAHCFDTAPKDKLHVVAGETLKAAYYMPYNKNFISKIMLHPDYNKKQFMGDIAVIKTMQPIKGHNIKYAKLCTQFLAPDNNAFVYGWGNTEYSPRTSDELRYMRVSIISKPECNKIMGRKMPINVICAWGNSGKTICAGDSGGPLVYRFELCGIATWTWKCGNTEKPDVYMGILPYRPFITTAMNKMNK